MNEVQRCQCTQITPVNDLILRLGEVSLRTLPYNRPSLNLCFPDRPVEVGKIICEHCVSTRNPLGGYWSHVLPRRPDRRQHYYSSRRLAFREVDNGDVWIELLNGNYILSYRSVTQISRHLELTHQQTVYFVSLFRAVFYMQDVSNGLLAAITRPLVSVWPSV